VTVKDRDRGWNEIRKQLRELDGATIKVGLQAGDPGGGGPSGATIAEIGFYNEFGTRRIPERSFIRSTADEKRGWRDITTKLYQSVLDRVRPAKTALELLGTMAQDDIKRKITTLRTPPNSPRTVEAKGSSNPLIDTGLMRASIRFVIGKDN